MSWSRLARPAALGAMLLGASLALGACSFSPVYSGALAEQPLLNFAYAKPNSRLEQVVYQELALRFGSSDSETAPLARVSVSVSTDRPLMSRTNNPNKLTELTVTATLVVTYRDGRTVEPVRLSHFATAQYTTSSQVLANNVARTDAAERAAKAAAESLRLAILASLSR
ncbi:hypothetical protein [Devosia sp. 2618]|uniref:hypothetical protein n=1 Tax=Devosia sp. 2618 TaxID=3156454 RepID=UPI0033927675